MTSRFGLRPAVRWLLGRDARQRLRLLQCGIAVVLSLFSIADMYWLVAMDLASPGLVTVWALVLGGGFLAFFGVIRSGRNLAFDEPSLTVQQMVFAIVCGAAGYAIAGPGRGGAFPILMVVFMFGMYALTAGQILRVGLFAVAVFGATMAVMSRVDPATYRPAVESSHFIMIAIMVPAVALMTARMSRMRERLRRQKRELAAALARIQDLATRDELTGLINRRHMVELMEQERQRGVRSGRTFCIALLCLDTHTDLTGSQGEATGDRLLAAFAHEAQSVLRISDLLSRWNGGQFLLMLSDTRAPLARLSLERLGERVQQLPVEPNAPRVDTGFVVGVTEHHAGESVAQTIERAERAMQTARGVAGSRIVLA